MDKKINLSQLAELMAQAGGMSKTASEQFVKSFFEIISQGVLNEGLVKVKGLGTFKLMQIEDRESVNVNTGERFTIEGHQKISFTPDAELKERINKPFALFETVVITENQQTELTRMDSGCEVTVSEGTEPDIEDEDNAVPMVREVTQKRVVRLLLKLGVWIFSIVLVLALVLFLFWPLIGNHVLAFVENNMKQREDAIQLSGLDNRSSDPVQEAIAFEESITRHDTVREAVPTVPAVSAVPAATAAPAVTEPKVETVVDAIPAESVNPVKPVEVEASAPGLGEVMTVKLNSADQAKNLADFTVADTLSFITDGELAVHTLKSGETIVRLALKYYGTKKLWPYIVKYNNLKDSGSKLVEGARIRIPVLKVREQHNE